MDYYLRAAFALLGLLIAQTMFLSFLSIGGVVPDILLIWVVYLAVTRGQLEATIAGFLVGLLQDATTTQFFGLAALAKTMAGFTGGYFFNENKTEQTLGTYRFMIIVVVCSLVHNIVYFAIFLQGETALFERLLQFSATTALYTGAMSALPMFAFSRKFLTT